MGKFLEALKIFNQVREKQRSVSSGSRLRDTRITDRCLELLRSFVTRGKFAELQEQCIQNAAEKPNKATPFGDKKDSPDVWHEAGIGNWAAEEVLKYLHVAIGLTNTKTLESFLKYGKEHLDSEKFSKYINAKQSKFGRTALHIAACNGDLGMMRGLLRFGAIYNIKNDRGETPYEQTKHESAKNLLDLVGRMFEKAKKTSKTVIDELANLEKEDRSAVMGAKDESGQTLEDILVATSQRTLVLGLLKLLEI